MADTIRILGFAGSIRKDSFNKALLSSAKDFVPKDAVLEIYGLEGIPVYSQDLEPCIPEKVREFKAKAKAADAILISTPEYNYSIPGVLKNALDWVSRPPGDNSLEGKPVAIMGASPGMLGTARAQYHLRQVFVFLNMHPINQPEVFVNYAAEKFTKDGRLADEKTREKVRALVENLVLWTKQLHRK